MKTNLRAIASLARKNGGVRGTEVTGTPELEFRFSAMLCARCLTCEPGFSVPKMGTGYLFIRSCISPFNYQSLERYKLLLIPKSSAFRGMLLLSRCVSVLQRT